MHSNFQISSEMFDQIQAWALAWPLKRSRSQSRPEAPPLILCHVLRAVEPSPWSGVSVHGINLSLNPPCFTVEMVYARR